MFLSMEMFDTSDYPVDHMLQSDQNKKSLGKMKDEGLGLGLGLSLYMAHQCGPGSEDLSVLTINPYDCLTPTIGSRFDA